MSHQEGVPVKDLIETGSPHINAAILKITKTIQAEHLTCFDSQTRTYVLNILGEFQKAEKDENYKPNTELTCGFVNQLVTQEKLLPKKLREQIGKVRAIYQKHIVGSLEGSDLRFLSSYTGIKLPKKAKVKRSNEPLKKKVPTPKKRTPEAMTTSDLLGLILGASSFDSIKKNLKKNYQTIAQSPVLTVAVIDLIVTDEGRDLNTRRSDILRFARNAVGTGIKVTDEAKTLLMSSLERFGLKNLASKNYSMLNKLGLNISIPDEPTRSKRLVTSEDLDTIRAAKSYSSLPNGLKRAIPTPAFVIAVIDLIARDKIMDQIKPQITVLRFLQDTMTDNVSFNDAEKIQLTESLVAFGLDNFGSTVIQQLNSYFGLELKVP